MNVARLKNVDSLGSLLWVSSMPRLVTNCYCDTISPLDILTFEGLVKLSIGFELLMKVSQIQVPNSGNLRVEKFNSGSSAS